MGSSGGSSGSCCCPTPGLPQAPAPRGQAAGPGARQFADLRVGDYVVHEDHGVGKLLGFETKEVASVTRDYLYLAFRGEDRLYVPHEQLGKLSRYIGADASAPSLSKLGGKAWQNLKARAREPSASSQASSSSSTPSASAPRASRTTCRTSGSSGSRRRSRIARPTTRQRAIEAVKEDLESPRPMDRLVCGDVGFGKTEVAVRAAFAVAVNGRQVLVLCPTTILAEQHWNTFRERYRDFPVRVEMVSRFRRPAEVKRVLAEFTEGKVEVLVGTHRMLSRDVIPKDLGLVDRRRGAAVRRRRRRSFSGRCGSRSTCWRSPPRRYPARCTCRSRACATSRSSRRHPRAGGRSGRRSASTTRSSSSCARARARARRAVVLPPQPRRDDRRGRREAAPAVPRPAVPRRARPDGGARARGADARVPRGRRGRARVDHDHRVRASTSRRRTRWSWSAPTCSGWPSCTRSAGASAART